MVVLYVSPVHQFGPSFQRQITSGVGIFPCRDSYEPELDHGFLAAFPRAINWGWVGGPHTVEQIMIMLSFPHVLSPLGTFFFFQVKSGKNEW